MTDEQNQDEKFPKDEGDHTPPHGTKPIRTAEQPEAETEETPSIDTESARQGDVVLDSQKKRRTFIALLAAAIILLALIAIFS